jgi:hypothetical protein
LPVLREQGQAEVRASTGLSGTELQLAYQVTNNLVVHSSLLGYGLRREQNRFNSADLGLGYYYSSPNGFWRLGAHAGAAYGGGTSSSSGPRGLGLGASYNVRYTYAYIQPTVLLLEGSHTWGVGLRMGRAYYHRLIKSGADSLGGPVLSTSYAGRQHGFVQATFQSSRRLTPWLTVSTSFGAQGFFKDRAFLMNMDPFIGQVGLHLTLRPRTVLQP